MSSVTGNDQEVLFEITLSHQKSVQNLKEPSFLVTTNTGKHQVDLDRQMVVALKIPSFALLTV